MGKLLSVKETAKLWNIPDTQVTRYCRAGRVAGARKESGVWMIPEDTAKPADKRKKENVLLEQESQSCLPLPIGISSYREACTKYYYIDKTLLIKEFLDEIPKVSLFTRPRRFGKTLTMDMLRTFFEATDEDTSVYFCDKKIWRCGEQYQKHQGQYPVIFLTFKDVKCDTWEKSYNLIIQLIQKEYIRHSELAHSETVTLKHHYDAVVSGQADEEAYMLSLMYLSQMLHEHYGTAPIIIIDEYDTPIQEGYTKDYYDKVIGFMRNLFSGGLKDNDHLSFGFLTGILRVAKESTFSGLNNLKVNSILDQKYSQYFGFTPEEVQEMAAYYHASAKYDEICAWYNGYRFGNTDIFNPWSVINYFSHDCKPRAFWQSTGSNEIIGELLSQANDEIYQALNDLLQGKPCITSIDTSVIYPEIKQNPASIYSFLLVAGYLKVMDIDSGFYGDFICTVAIPNKEITLVYKKEILNRMHKIVPQSASFAIQQALYTKDIQRLQKHLQTFLLESVSCYDTTDENSYHMLLLGLCAITSDRYYLTSNRESGKGRYDLQLMPKDTNMPGILIEVKTDKNSNEAALTVLSEAALKQINDRCYEADMVSKGISTIFKYGVAFSGKQVKITAG